MKAHFNLKQFVAFIFFLTYSYIFTSSGENRYPCPDCHKALQSPPALVRHRRTVHGYQPYHTPCFLARRAVKEAEKWSGEATMSNPRDNQAANKVLHSSQGASSSSDTGSLILCSKATYHDDSRKLLVDVPRHGSQGVQISVPIDMAPAPDTSRTLHSDSGLSLPTVGQKPSMTRKCDISYLLNPKTDDTVKPQSQTLTSPRFLARRAVKEAEKENGLATWSPTHDQQAASVDPSSTQGASSSSDTGRFSDLSSNATYHDSGKMLVDVPRHGSQGVQINVPIAMAPARDTPKTVHSDSGLSLPTIGHKPPTNQKYDISYLLNPKSDDTVRP